ncbi:PAS domain-containing protein [Hydrogenophaga aromaticivorans]|uniref:PAS domain-containing protein n=1 Tax=Hydrogenophaga aromaticivorans TaxID=2610898 RepID=UPI001B38C0AE|nr:PAS domain-containing protein [Hydrogenophaga aromaticivorans]MBQ0922062.1 PAS domain-containing protein [Hydrogenophaga aromaticivorans]
MSWTRWPLTIAGRWLVPLLMIVFALAVMSLRYQHQMRQIDQDVSAQESQRLRERLSIEQTRMDEQAGLGNSLLLHRLVGGLALHQGLNQAYLVGPDERVLTSLSRLDIGQPLNAVLSRVGGSSSPLQALAVAPSPSAIVVERLAQQPVFIGLVPLQGKLRLLVQVDMSYPLAARRASEQAELVREGLVLLAAVVILTVLLHLLWFRRAKSLALALTAMGAGNLSVRTGLIGRDELAHIGEAADRMAEQLQAGQDRIRRMSDIINRSPLVVIEWRNAEGWPVRYVSDSVSQWGYQPADLLNGPLQYIDLIHPDDVQQMNDEVTRYFAQGPDEYRQEYRIRKADGGWAWIEDRTSLTRDERGEVDTISGILLDTTVQKEAQLAQREQAEQLRMFYELPFLGMAISSPLDKRWLQVNDRLCEILGYPREELLDMSWAQMTPPGDLERNVALFDELLAGQRSGYQMAKRFVRKDGSMVHTELDVRAVRDRNGRIRQLFATIQDVTERTQAEAALQDYKEMLEQAEALVQLGSWAGDVESQQLTISAQLVRNIGLDPAGRMPSDAEYLARIHPDDRAMVAEDMQCIRNGGEAGDLVFRTDPAHGPMRWLRRTVRRISRETEGRGPRYIGTLLDITEAVAAEARLKRLNQELEERVAERTAQLSQANMELEAFSYTVSHDLKAPLRGIDGYSQLLVEEYGDRLDDEGRRFVERIRKGVQQMSDLIADLLAYSRIERRDMVHEPVALLPLVEQVVDSYHADIEKHGTEVRLAMEPFTLPLDREGMAVVLRNLIGNALKFSRDSASPRIEIGARHETGRRILWVRDNGVGFDLKYHDRIFGIFQRLHRAEEFPGTGVGLALVAKAVQRMGGRVWAESQPGAGATFYLEFLE